MQQSKRLPENAICHQEVKNMKPYLKSFLLIVFGLPLLIACLMIAAALLNGDLFMDLSWGCPR